MIHPHFRSARRGLALLLGLGTALSVGIGQPLPVRAFPWGELILQGIQVLQLSNLSNQQRVDLGQSIHQQVSKNYQFDTNSQDASYVNRVGQRVAAASDCTQYPFHFYVVRNSQINAFSTTGGYVYVHSGLLKATDNEDQLASVLGHEIGHICNDDVVNRLKQSQIAQGVAGVAGIDTNVLAAAAYKIAVDLPHSRQDEFNADAKGLQYMTRAGYKPREMTAFLSKLLNSSSPPTLLSDHPGTQERIQVLERQIAAHGQ